MIDCTHDGAVATLWIARGSARNALPIAGWQALAAAPGSTAVLNAANEVAVDAFLAERIRFDQIHTLNLATLEAVAPSNADSLQGLLALDAQTRAVAGELVQRFQ